MAQVLDLLRDYGVVLATLVLAGITGYYAWLIRKQVVRDERLDDPELKVYPGPVEYYDTGSTKADEQLSIKYTIVLVNPGRTPIVITDFEEKVSELRKTGFSLMMEGQYDLPPIAERPARVFMSASPWVIGAKDFAVWARRFPPEWWSGSSIVRGIGYRVDVAWQYKVGEKEKVAKGTSQTYLR